jgi:hypothetical protein
VGEVGERWRRYVRGRRGRGGRGGGGELEYALSGGSTSTTAEVNEVIGDEGGGLNGERAQGNVGGEKVAGSEASKDGETSGFCRRL